MHFLRTIVSVCGQACVQKRNSVFAKVCICAVMCRHICRVSVCEESKVIKTKTHAKSPRKAVSKSLLFILKDLSNFHTTARVCMINKKQLFHEMLGGERVLSLWDPTIPLTLKFLLVNKRKKRGGWEEKRRNMLETLWKASKRGAKT